MSESQSSSASLNQLMLALGVAAFASQIGYRITDPVTPLIAGDFSVSITSAAALATAYAITYGLAQPVLGPLGDTFGKANLIRISMALLAVSLLVSAVAVSFSMLAVARAAGGIAGAGIIPATIAIVGDRVPLADRQVMLARVMAVNYIGILSGPALSGMVGSAAGWRMVFIVGAVIIGAAAVFTFPRLKPRANVERPRFSIARVRQHYVAVFSRPMVWPFFGLVVLEGMASFASAPYVADIMARRSTASTFEAGIVLACFGVGGILFTFLARRLVPWLGMKRQMQAGGLTCATAMVGFALISWWPLNAATFFAFGFGFLMLHITLQTLATELTPESRGSAMAVFALVFFIGQASGPLAFGGLRHLAGDVPALLWQAATMAFVGIAASYLLVRPARA